MLCGVELVGSWFLRLGFKKLSLPSLNGEAMTRYCDTLNIRNNLQLLFYLTAATLRQQQSSSGGHLFLYLGKPVTLVKIELIHANTG